MSWLLAIYFLLLFPGAPVSKAREELPVIIAEEGETTNVTCKFQHPINRALQLNRILRRAMQVLHVSVWEKRKTEAPEYANRTEYFEMDNMVTIMLRQVKQDDSDVYMCEGRFLEEGEPKDINSSSIMLAVKAASDNKLRNSSSSLWMLGALIIQSLLLVAVLAYCILSPKNNKKFCKKSKEKEAQNTVYEDMSCSLRQESLPGTNLYYT
nr:uncharacterized protein LOC110075047 isoform X1 [Pogona vitticeps]